MANASRKLLLFVGWLSGLCLAVWLVGVAFTGITHYLDASEMKVPLLMAKDGESHDVLFIGNSIPMEGINPAVIDAQCGTNSYNMCLGGQTFSESEYVLRHYLGRNDRPKLIVLGISPNRHDVGDGLRPTVRLALDDEVLEHFRSSRQEKSSAKSMVNDLLQRLPAYRYRAAVERLLKYLAQGTKRVPRFIQGHVAMSIVGPKINSWPQHEAGFHRQGFESLMSYCDEQDLPVLVIELPNTPAFNASVIGRDQVMTSMQSCIDRFPHIRFLSFNDGESITIPADEWIGLNHLNDRGAIRFSEHLAPHITRAIGALAPSGAGM